jgi:hypothetical protein
MTHPNAAGIDHYEIEETRPDGYTYTYPIAGDPIGAKTFSYPQL